MSNQRGMFQQNPGAVLGSSWGNLNGNQQQQQQPAAQQPTPSSMSYDDEDMSDDFYSDESDEEDAPLQISSWGEQTTKKDGTTEYNVSAEGWAALIDPNFKLGPGGLGSGNLHRKGGNYKPVDEEYILNHRLKKGSPMPKSASGSPSGRGKKKKPKSGAGRGRGAPSRPPPKPTPPPPSRSYTRAPPTNNAWGSTPLADKPFWEQPASAARPPPQQQQQQQQQQQPKTQQGSSASKYATDTVMSEGSNASKWATGSAASKYAPTPMSTSSSADSIYASPEAKKQVDTGPNILSINISFLPGVYATLNVPRQDHIDYVKLVEQFAADHHLTMEDNAKSAFANNIGQLVELELAKRR
ncbi:hypothetical protein BJV82DRAFT_573547 [Fennellomyces sp. T-0311]|nr:hypothetical protein BJV82DRAFT_573547 [Fennellomyces sp. T-0311]